MYDPAEASDPNRQPLIEEGIAMGVHHSTKWESVALGPEHTLVFRCIPIQAHA